MYIYETRVTESSSSTLRKGRIHFRFWQKIFVTIFILLMFVGKAWSQFYEYGQDPGSLRWSYFNSEHYQLIYPVGLDSIAMSFADKMEYFYPFQAEVLDYSHKRMPVIFHNESSFSNGVFVWAPRRLEVFTNPDPNGYPQDWMTQLALHEGRHAFQVSKLDQGITKVLSFIGGEQAQGAVTGFLPLWYLEGDAVDAETRFSYTGRGRLPSFEMGMKAILFEKEEPYNFSKALLGSYKDYVPNHYELGYLMVHYARKKYGDQFWIDFENYAARKPFLIVPSYFSMKSYGVNSKLQLYQEALDYYKKHWEQTGQRMNIGELTTWSENSSHYTNYRFPQWVDDTTIIAYKTSVDQIPEFVLLTASGKESRVFRPGYLNSGRFSYRKGILVWDEFVADTRWSNRNYSQIRVYDMKTRSLRKIGYKRYYNPSLSFSGDKIVATEQLPGHIFNLVILDLQGSVIHRINSPENLMIQQPSWMAEDSAVIATIVKDEGEYLYQYSFDRNEWNELFYSGHNDMSYPVVYGSDIYMKSTFSGLDDIYRYNLPDEQLYQVNSAEFGNFYPSVSDDGKRLCFSDYHSSGHRVVVKEEIFGSPIEYDVSGCNMEQVDSKPTTSEKQILIGAAQMPEGEYSPKPYRKLLNAVNVHSWLPLYFDYMNPETALSLEELPVSPGFTLLSQNLLSTVSGMLAYEYKDQLHYLHTGVRLKGRYPVLDLSLNVGGYPNITYIDTADVINTRPDRVSINAVTYVPFRLNTGKFISYVQPSIGLTYTSDIFPDESRENYNVGKYLMQYRLYASSYLRMSRKDILPRLGFAAYYNYMHAPFKSNLLSTVRSASVSIYLPGPYKHQSIKLNYRNFLQEEEHYLYPTNTMSPRGMVRLMAGLEMHKLSADLSFPIMYPDWNIEPLFYFQRIRGNLWADYFNGISVNDYTDSDFSDRKYYSLGIDLEFDFNFLRIAFPISLGVQTAWLPQEGIIVPKLLLNVDVN